jgi:hypothetical protein
MEKGLDATETCNGQLLLLCKASQRALDVGGRHAPSSLIRQHVSPDLAVGIE